MNRRAFSFSQTPIRTKMHQIELICAIIFLELNFLESFGREFVNVANDVVQGRKPIA